MKYLLLALISFNTMASVAELFGASAHNVMVGNQFFSEKDAANNYYNPAIIAFSKENLFSYSNHAIKTDFTEISNVTTENALNNNSTNTGNVDTNYPLSTSVNLHLAMKLFKKVKLGLSFYSPATKIVSASTGDSYTPEYVMYRSRYNRLLMSLNLAYRYSDDISFSLGLTNGMKTEGEAYMVATLDSGSVPSNGKIKFDVTPTIGLILSTAIRLEKKGLLLFTFHQEVKSEFENKTFGKTPFTGGGGELPFNINMDSMLFYDPQILRATWVKYLSDKVELISTLEWQDWNGYKLPKLNFTSISGFKATTTYGDYNFKHIIIPRVAVKYNLNSDQSFTAGLFYRQSPIEVDLNSASNMIDPDVLAFTAGHSRSFDLLGQNVNLAFAYQLHYLLSENIVKTANMENGAAGDKIGTPGYDTGGNVHVLSFGLNWSI